MKWRALRRPFRWAPAISALIAAAAVAQRPPEPKDLVGDRIGAVCATEVDADGTPRYSNRYFHFTEDSWRFATTVFSDAECSEPFFTLGIAGRYELGPPVDAIPGARRGDFYRYELTLTPHSQSAIGFFEGQGCVGDWRVHQPRDIATRDCLGLESTAECPIDRDIVGWVDGEPTPGVRGDHMCDEAGRPTRLQARGLQPATAGLPAPFPLAAADSEPFLVTRELTPSDPARSEALLRRWAAEARRAPGHRFFWLARPSGGGPNRLVISGWDSREQQQSFERWLAGRPDLRGEDSLWSPEPAVSFEVFDR